MQQSSYNQGKLKNLIAAAKAGGGVDKSLCVCL